MNASGLNSLVNTAMAPEIRLPDSQPLTLTRNFGWVVGFCMASLLVVPLAVAWMASLVLNT